MREKMLEGGGYFWWVKKEQFATNKTRVLTIRANVAGEAKHKVCAGSHMERESGLLQGLRVGLLGETPIQVGRHFRHPSPFTRKIVIGNTMENKFLDPIKCLWNYATPHPGLRSNVPSIMCVQTYLGGLNPGDRLGLSPTPVTPFYVWLSRCIKKWATKHYENNTKNTSSCFASKASAIIPLSISAIAESFCCAQNEDEWPPTTPNVKKNISRTTRRKKDSVCERESASIMGLSPVWLSKPAETS